MNEEIQKLIEDQILCRPFEKLVPCMSLLINIICLNITMIYSWQLGFKDIPN